MNILYKLSTLEFSLSLFSSRVKYAAKVGHLFQEHPVYISASAPDISRRQHMVADTCCTHEACVSRAHVCMRECVRRGIANHEEFIERRRVWERVSSRDARETFISADFSLSLSAAGWKRAPPWRGRIIPLSTMLLDMRVYTRNTRMKRSGEPERARQWR